MSSELFDELRKSIKEAGKIRKGRAKPSRKFTYDAIDIRKLRESLGVSQSQFARMIGVSVDTAQNWEQVQYRDMPLTPDRGFATMELGRKKVPNAFHTRRGRPHARGFVLSVNHTLPPISRNRFTWMQRQARLLNSFRTL